MEQIFIVVANTVFLPPDQTIPDQGCLNPFIDFWSLILVEVTSRELFKPPRGVVARCENVRVGELGSFESGGCQDAIPAHIGTTERHMGGRTILATQKSGLVGDLTRTAQPIQAAKQLPFDGGQCM